MLAESGQNVRLAHRPVFRTAPPEKFSKTNSFRPRLVPATADSQPALRRLRSADEGVHFFGELFEHHWIGCGSVA
jgi:hypothetical protein